MTIEADRDSKWEDSDAKAALRDYLISITGSEDRNQSMLFTVLTSMSKWAIAYLDDGWWELKADELGHLDRISQYYSDIGVNLMYMREGACNIWNIDWTDVAVIANPSDYPKECVKWFGTGEYVGVQVPNPEGVWRVSERRGTVLAESIAAENLLACLVITRVDICG